MGDRADPPPNIVDAWCGDVVAEEFILVLFDPVANRYWGGDHGVIFVRAARPFMSLEAAVKAQAWWKTKRFSEIRRVRLQLEVVEPPGSLP